MSARAHNQARNIRQGFTIVELLIVIVVIGILAAISLVAYNGMQDRARDAKRVSAADAYEKLLLIYNSRNGKFPPLSTTHDSTCLGEKSHYPAKDGFPEGVCYQLAGEWGNSAIGAVDDDFNSALRLLSSSLPDGSYTPYTVELGGDGAGSAYRMRGVVAFRSGNGGVGIGYMTADDSKPCSGRFIVSGAGDGMKICEIRLN